MTLVQNKIKDITLGGDKIKKVCMREKSGDMPAYVGDSLAGRDVSNGEPLTRIQISGGEYPGGDAEGAIINIREDDNGNVGSIIETIDISEDRNKGYTSFHGFNVTIPANQYFWVEFKQKGGTKNSIYIASHFGKTDYYVAAGSDDYFIPDTTASLYIRNSNSNRTLNYFERILYTTTPAPVPPAPGGFPYIVNEDTKAWYKLEDNPYDYGTEGYDLTNFNDSVEFTELDGVKCAYFDGGVYNKLMRGDQYSAIPMPLSNRMAHNTISIWYYLTEHTAYDNIFGFGAVYGNGGLSIWADTGRNALMLGGWDNDRDVNTTYELNRWNNITITTDAITARVKTFFNGQLVDNWNHEYSLNVRYFVLGGNPQYPGYPDSGNMKGYISNVIVEAEVWDDDKVASFYNSCKPYYGLS